MSCHVSFAQARFQLRMQDALIPVYFCYIADEIFSPKLPVHTPSTYDLVSELTFIFLCCIRGHACFVTDKIFSPCRVSLRRGRLRFACKVHRYFVSVLPFSAASLMRYSRCATHRSLSHLFALHTPALIPFVCVRSVRNVLSTTSLMGYSRNAACEHDLLRTHGYASVRARRWCPACGMLLLPPVVRLETLLVLLVCSAVCW